MPLALYRDLRAQCRRRPIAPSSMTARATSCRLSPELFFDLSADGRLTARPMKGTAPRGADARADAAARDALANSAKDRAENLMIVDLLRNDLGRIAEIGSVAVEGSLRASRPIRRCTPWSRPSPPGSNPARDIAAIAEGAVSLRFDHRRAQDPRHGDHRRARGVAARRLLRRHRPFRAGRLGALQRRHPHTDDRRSAAANSASAAPSSTIPRPQGEYDECLLKARYYRGRVAGRSS